MQDGDANCKGGLGFKKVIKLIVTSLLILSFLIKFAELFKDDNKTKYGDN